MQKKTKSTRIEKERRLFIIQGWIIEGIQDNIIVKNIVEKTDWGIESVRQAQRLVREAYETWSKIEGVNIERKREMKIARLQQQIKTLKHEYKGTPAGIAAIMMVEKELIKLEGLAMPKQIEINTPIKAIEFRVVRGKDSD